MSTSTVCLIAKNEGRYLQEWIAHQLAIGFDQILIYDNESSDDSKMIIEAFAAATGRVMYVFWPDVAGVRAQVAAYSDALRRAKTEWMAFFDADEFLVLKRHDSMREFLSSYGPEAGAIAINWLLFGSSGQKKYAPELVTKRFRRCAHPSIATKIIKTIARVSAVASNEVHSVVLKSGRYYNADGAPVEVVKNRTPEVFHSTAQLNHYSLKSHEEYLLKRAKGNAARTPDLKAQFMLDVEKFWNVHDRNERSDDAIARWYPKIEANLKLLGERVPT